MVNQDQHFFCTREERIAYTLDFELKGNLNYIYEGRLEHWTESSSVRMSQYEANLTKIRELFEELRTTGVMNPETVNRENLMTDIITTSRGQVLYQMLHDEENYSNPSEDETSY